MIQIVLRDRRPTVQCRKFGGGGTGGEDKLSSALMPECKGLRWIQLMEFKTEPEEEFEGGI